jgi:hypothetical protein
VSSVEEDPEEDDNVRSMVLNCSDGQFAMNHSHLQP